MDIPMEYPGPEPEPRLMGSGLVYVWAGSYPETSLTGGSQPHAHPLEGGTDQADSLPPFLSFEMVVRVA